MDHPEAGPVLPIEIILRIFPGLPQPEAQALLENSEICEYPPGMILCHEDAYETIFYIILNGRVQVSKRIAADQERRLKVLERGDFFGEMALIHRAPRAATVRTLVPTRVIEVRKVDFDRLLSSSASVARAMVQEVSRRLRENDEMAIEDLRLKAGELASAYQRLAEQEYARREFLSAIAHELRTPLTAASGFLYMVQTGILEGQSFEGEMMQAALRSASRNLNRIITLVNDILFVQEMDLILPRFEPIDLSLLLNNVKEMLKHPAIDNQVTVKIRVPASLPKIPGDARSLERAFTAILDNAIKFNQPGSTVRVRAGNEGEMVWVEVADQGPGIPEQALPHVFDRFFRVDELEGRYFRGVGLGLSIARQVIEQHDGAIAVSSRVGQGTSVRVELPTRFPNADLPKKQQ